MRLFPQRVPAANARGEKPGQSKLAQLTADAVAIAAGNQAQGMLPANLCQNAAGSRDQLGPVFCVMHAPGTVGIVPKFARQLGGAVNLVPVRRVVFLEFLKTPRNA